MHHPLTPRIDAHHIVLIFAAFALLICAPDLAMAQASPFMTGASSLQTNILAWLTPVAIILVMVLGGMAMANRIVENCGTTLILRCSGSENGGTSQFASRLIGEREILRRQVSRGRDRDTAFSARGGRRSRSITDQHVTETAVMPSEIEQLPDLHGYLKGASSAVWLKVALARGSRV
jgi:Type IV secretion-system coupling protein DNA-binding domain